MKPSDLYVGVIDLFAIVLPGSIFTWFLVDELDLGSHGSLAATGPGAKWVAFLMVAYAVGHFIFLIASQLDLPYDLYRRWRWPDRERNAFRTASGLRKECTGGSGSIEAMNTFSWAKATLLLEKPAAYASVQRFEADSKFFRSLVVVLLLLAFGFVGVSRPMAGIICFALAVPAFFRYAERRYKSTEWAYRYVITLKEAGITLKEGGRDEPQGGPDE